jgi:uncharacterized protein (TIGR03067 family)
MQVTDATAEVIWNDLRPILDEELDRLPVKCRGAVVLCYLEGLKVETAAQQLGCPRGTVLSRLARARDLLRTRLAKRGLVFTAGFLGLLLARKAPTLISLPSAFVQATAKAACAFAVVGSVPTTGMAQRPAKIAQGVLTAMLLAKLKLGVAWVLVASVVLVGAAIAIRHGIVASSRNAGAHAQDGLEPGEDQAPPEDLARLQGAWRVVEMVDANGKTPPDQIKEYRWIIDGDGFTMVGCHADPQKPEPMKNKLGNVMQFRFHLDAGRRPKAMDISVDGTPCWVAIYELNGDTLRVCTAKTGSPRPTGFVQEGDTIVWVFLAEGRNPLPDK